MAKITAEPPETDRILDTPFDTALGDRYLVYALSTITARSLPDLRDGLKPVHRRILYTMHRLGLTPGSRFRKSALVVGDVLGKYHPHGDSAVYESMVKLAQPFSTRYPLVLGQGNFGSMDGDNAAAMRYTEIRMARIAHELLADLDKETVDFGPNYDGSEHEPLIMPARIPNLLINGSSGIAVGMATNIPPHNLNEVVDACLALLNKNGKSSSPNSFTTPDKEVVEATSISCTPPINADCCCNSFPS